MTKRRKLAVAILLVAVVAAVPLVGGHGKSGSHSGSRHGGMSGMEHIREMHAELGLTEAQGKELHAIFKKVHEDHESNKQRLHSSFLEAGKLLIADPNNLSGARAVLERNHAAEREFHQSILESLSRGLNSLTPEQRQKLSTRVERMHGRSQNH